MSKINVLVFPAEGQNAYELHDALSTCVNINLFGASSVARHGKYIFENYRSDLPFAISDNFIESLNNLLLEWQIDIIFPTHDSICSFFAENADRINAQVLTADLKTSDVCRSKIKTYELFAKDGIMPKGYSSINTKIEYPVFVKPDKGQGAVGAKKIDTEDELKQIVFSDYLVTELLPGEEWTVDCLTDKDGNLRYISPRSRDRILAGIAAAGRTQVLTEDVERMAKIINSKLNFLGLWYFQIKRDKDGNFKLLEISARCAGSMVMTRAKGINLPLLSVYTALGYDINVYDNGYQAIVDRALFGRYELPINYNHVYIDFDDTITLRGNVNVMAMHYLYQCKNKGIKVYLLTHHPENIHDSLYRYAISEKLFDEIIHLTPDVPKSQYIKHKDSIFIDNAFNLRTEVRTNAKIPVFDVDAFEFLLDWKI